MEKEKIRQSVKTAYSKYGLKDATIEKITNMIADRIGTMGEIENEDEAVANEISKAEAYVSLIQSEADARMRRGQLEPQAQTPVGTQNQNPNAGEELQQALQELMANQQRLEQKIAQQEQVALREACIADAKRMMIEDKASNEIALDYSFLKIKDRIENGMSADDLKGLWKTAYEEINTRLMSSGGYPEGGSGTGISASTRAAAAEFEKQLAARGIEINKTN